jgi:hypothetical protein
LDLDNAVRGQQVNSSGIYQQYVMIKGMELRVTSPLTQAQESEANSFSVVGTANTYPFLIPNVGDMFRANVGDGRLALFQITRSEQKSIYKEACFEIEYLLVEYDTPERMADLNSKVVETVVFVRDFLMHGQNPLLHEEDYALFGDLANRFEEITRDYFRTFFVDEYKTVLLPGQGTSIYDPFLMQVLTGAFTTWDADEIRHLRKLNVDGDVNLKTQQIWEALFTGDKDMLDQCAPEMCLVSAREWIRDPMMESVYHSGVRYVIYPKNTANGLDYGIRQRLVPSAPLEIVMAPCPTRKYQNQTNPIPTINIPDLPIQYQNTPLIHPILKDSYYVFTKEFYDQAEGQSLLEVCVSDYLEGKNVPNRVLLEFCKQYKQWGGLEIFYYVPVILLLLKANIRRM